jgi:hypothetical protein
MLSTALGIDLDLALHLHTLSLSLFVSLSHTRAHTHTSIHTEVLRGIGVTDQEAMVCLFIFCA